MAREHQEFYSNVHVVLALHYQGLNDAQRSIINPLLGPLRVVVGF